MRERQNTLFEEPTMEYAVFAGSFDPPTFGHLDIIKRSAAIFGGLEVLVADNPKKTYLFSLDERIALLEELTHPFRNVRIASTTLMVTDYLRENALGTLSRGVRNVIEYSAEADLAAYNSILLPGAETLLLLARPEFQALSSSGVKEVAAFGGSLDGLVPPVVATALTKKLKKC
jgi:pantetheine-phosphate adenylyltransferase